MISPALSAPTTPFTPSGEVHPCLALDPGHTSTIPLSSEDLTNQILTEHACLEFRQWPGGLGAHSAQPDFFCANLPGTDDVLLALLCQGPPGRPGLPGADGLPGPPGTMLMLPVSMAELQSPSGLASSVE